MIVAHRQKTVRQLWFPDSPVAVVHELVEILLQLGRGDSMERAEQKVLEIRDGGVHLRQPLVDLRGRGGLGLNLDALLERQDPVRPPAVGADAELVPESSKLSIQASARLSASTKAAATVLNQKRDGPVGTCHSRVFRLAEQNSNEY